MEFGAEYATDLIIGDRTMLKLFAGNWDFLRSVCPSSFKVLYYITVLTKFRCVCGG